MSDPVCPDSASRLGPAADVREGAARGYPEAGLFVVRHRGQLHAWRDACPHYGDTPMAWRRDAYLDAAATRIICAAHGAQFEIDTGLCVLGPCLGQSLTAVPIRVNRDGDIERLSSKQAKDNES